MKTIFLFGVLVILLLVIQAALLDVSLTECWIANGYFLCR